MYFDMCSYACWCVFIAKGNNRGQRNIWIERSARSTHRLYANLVPIEATKLLSSYARHRVIEFLDVSSLSHWILTVWRCFLIGRSSASFAYAIADPWIVMASNVFTTLILRMLTRATPWKNRCERSGTGPERLSVVAIRLVEIERASALLTSIIALDDSVENRWICN